MKKALYIIWLLDGLICIIFLFLLQYENGRAAVGLDALSSVGRWVVYAAVLSIAAIVLIITTITIIVKYRKK